MKGSFAAVTLFAALLSSACSQPGSPTGPSSARQGNMSLDPVTVVAGTRDASAASLGAQSVPFKGRLEGMQTFTPPNFVNGSATGNATHLGEFTVVFPHTVDFATRTGKGTFT